MSPTPDKALLPAGLQDLLPPQAAYEADTAGRLIAVFRAHGFEQVKPPLIEFESALLSGAGAALSQQTFRLMDPVSQHMLALRADMTTQVARIAASRLSRAPRPLRLCYGGQVLRVKGTQLRPERQFAQVGAELIGSDVETADVEAVAMAVEALEAVGVPRLSVDLNLPPLVGALAEELGIDDATNAGLRQALDRKDAAAVDTLAGSRAELFRGLLRAAGPADVALERLAALHLPPRIAEQTARLSRVVELLQTALPQLALTVDPVEHRGFEYQTGISFTLYARGVRGELGRGGRYETDESNGRCEAATGFTLFMDSVMRALPPPPPAARVFVPLGTDAQRVRALRAEGWVTISELSASADAEAEARRQHCGYLLQNDHVVRLEPDSDQSNNGDSTPTTTDDGA